MQWLIDAMQWLRSSLGHSVSENKRVDLSTYRTKWLKHTVYGTKGTDANQWFTKMIMIGLGLRLG